MMVAFMVALFLAQAPNAEVGISAPAPTTDFEIIVQDWLEKKLLDYESARIKLVFGPKQMSFKKTVIARVEGEVACYDINAKNRFGGYAGNDRTLIVVKGGKVVYSASEIYPDGFTFFDVVSNVCGKTGRAQGIFFEPVPETQQTRSD